MSESGRVLRPQTNARSVVEPQTPAFGLFCRHLQPLTSPDPFDAFDVHHPAGIPQQRRDAAITVASVLDSERDNVGSQRRLIICRLRNLALRRAMLAKNPAGKSLGDAVFSSHMLHASTATRGA